MSQIIFSSQIPMDTRASQTFPTQPRINTAASKTLCDKIWKIFCCCCYVTPEPEVIELPEVTVRNNSHILVPASRRKTIIPGDPLRSLYNMLNKLDYIEVRALIQKDPGSFSEELIAQLLSLLQSMEEIEPFLDPKFIEKSIENFPSSYLEKIRACASLAVISQKGRELASTSIRFPVYNPIKNIYTALEICYQNSAQEMFQKFVGRLPETPQEMADTVRWGALHHFEEQSMPESIQHLCQETRVGEMTIDFKECTSDDISIPGAYTVASARGDLSPVSSSEESSRYPSILSFRQDPSLSSFVEETGVQSISHLHTDTSFGTLEELSPRSQSVLSSFTDVTPRDPLESQFDLNGVSVSALKNLEIDLLL